MDIKPLLNNKDEYPTDEILTRSLGKAKKAWDAFMEMLEREFPEISYEWRYYNDGKSWLCKVTKKKKTVTWVSVYDQYFKTSFYFTDKAVNLIDDSKLSVKYKNQFKNGKYYGKLKAISVEVKESSDLEMTRILINIKEQLK